VSNVKSLAIRRSALITGNIGRAGSGVKRLTLVAFLALLAAYNIVALLIGVGLDDRARDDAAHRLT